ncbi:MAG: helix-turn-helix domain-containing protein [Acidimicrobiales bacterium]
MNASTKDRLVDEAMRLFGEQGYRSTSVAQIEAAAGLSPGAGGLYHHFRSKEALLEAGIDRHLDRLRALRDIRRVFSGLADLRSELTVSARYTLQLIDEEAQLLRIVVSGLRDRPSRLTDAFGDILIASYDEFADWLRVRVPGSPEVQVRAVSAVALNALFAARMTHHILDADPQQVDDEAFVSEWVEMVAARIEALNG